MMIQLPVVECATPFLLVHMVVPPAASAARVYALPTPLFVLAAPTLSVAIHTVILILTVAVVVAVVLMEAAAFV